MVTAKEVPERRTTKRQKMTDSSVDARGLEARMMKLAARRLRTPKTHARPKKKSQRWMAVPKSSKSSVAMSERIASLADEEAPRDVPRVTWDLSKFKFGYSEQLAENAIL